MYSFKNGPNGKRIVITPWTAKGVAVALAVLGAPWLQGDVLHGTMVMILANDKDGSWIDSATIVPASGEGRSLSIGEIRRALKRSNGWALI
jgi:hypothetical protein